MSPTGTDSSSARLAITALAGGATIAGLAGSMAIFGGVSGAQQSSTAASLSELMMQAGQACVVSGPVRGLTTSQANNAGVIVSASFAASAENPTVAQVALMTAYTESRLQDPGPQPTGGDSLGLFQQRASQGWGTAAEEMDPAEASAMFVKRLLDVPGWSTLPPWVAAQDVQRSAFDGHPNFNNGFSSVLGGNYQANWTLAGQILEQVLALGDQSGLCGQDAPTGVAIGPDSAHGLPIGYGIPPGTGPAHTQAVEFALTELGKPYVWGAAGPESFDCSGLTMAAWLTGGIHLDHYTGDQQVEGVAVTAAQLTAGDLVLIPGSDSPGPGIAGHVGIYLGYGLVESAIDPQMGVAVQSWTNFVSGGITALRDPDPADV